MNEIPEGATYEWTPAQELQGFGVKLNQLRFFKKINDEWWVYSPVTNWRKSGNPSEWFAEETHLGYFKKIV